MSADHPPSEPPAGEAEVALVARLDHLERVLRQELAAQRARAERAEAQLRALGDIEEQAEDLVSAARAEATAILEAARAELVRAAAARAEAEGARARGRSARGRAPGAGGADGAPRDIGMDRELLVALRDHLIDTGALQAKLTAETRNAVVKLIQAAGQARGAPVLRPLASDPTAADPPRQQASR